MIKNMRKIILIPLIILISLSGCKKKSPESNPVFAPLPPVVSPVPDQKLIEAASFKIGTAISSNRMKAEPAYDNVLKSEFNQITAEYEMKMNYIWTADNAYNFENVDYLMSYAQQNKMEVHGHALLWYRSFPDWFKSAGYDSVMFESKVKDYITTVVGRYRGKIRSWDVANEIFNDDGSLRIESQIQGTFKDPVGFVGRCFKYAREADPAVKLFYNDYNVVLASGKRNAMKNMALRFKKEGFPIDGLGEQYHYGIRTNQSNITTGFNDLASSGFLIHISEIDSRVNVDRLDTYVFTDADKQKQADFYKNIAKLYSALPANQKFGITLWGLTDKYTWLRDRANGNPKEYPLLFDDNYDKKLAYSGFLEGLK